MLLTWSLTELDRWEKAFADEGIAQFERLLSLHQQFYSFLSETGQL